MNKILLVAVLFGTEIFAAPKETVYEIKDCKVGFNTTSSPDLVNIEGTGGHCSGSLKVSGSSFSGVISSQLGDYDTGISLRNKHMREKYLEVGKYPEAILTIKNQKDGGEIEGSLKIKKDEKPVKVKYEVKDGVGKASFKLEIKDYPSIGVPSYLGVTAANTVDVSVEFKY